MANSGKTINFAADLIPDESGSYNIGSSDSKWNINAEAIIASTIKADTIDANIASLEICSCATDASTAAKTVTTNNTNWKLDTGSMIAIKFTNSNSASSVTLNVNETGAKSIWYNNAIYTGNEANITGVSNRYNYYIYDGTYWVWLLSADLKSKTFTEAPSSTTTVSIGDGWYKDGSYYIYDPDSTPTAYPSDLSYPSDSELSDTGWQSISGSLSVIKDTTEPTSSDCKIWIKSASSLSGIYINNS